jgi:hypothetical protein
MLAFNDRTAPSPLKMLAFDTMAVPKHYTPLARDGDNLICFVNARVDDCAGLQTVWINATTRRVIGCPPEHMLNSAQIVDAAGRVISPDAAAQKADALLTDDEALQQFLSQSAQRGSQPSLAEGDAASVRGPSGMYTPVSPISPASPSSSVLTNF